MRGVRIDPSGEWLCLDACEDTTNRFQSRSSSRYYNAEYARRSVWTRINTTYIEEVRAGDSAVLDMKEDEDFMTIDLSSDTNITNNTTNNTNNTKSLVDKYGGTGDMFDKPFVPRMGDADNPVEESSTSSIDDGLGEAVALQVGEEDKMLSTVKKTVKSLNDNMVSVPIGSKVMVSGLSSRSGMQYNGVTGVVVSGIYAGSGRQGVRLGAPFRYVI